jgi:hypothetical protein
MHRWQIIGFDLVKKLPFNSASGSSPHDVFNAMGTKVFQTIKTRLGVAEGTIMTETSHENSGSFGSSLLVAKLSQSIHLSMETGSPMSLLVVA